MMMVMTRCSTGLRNAKRSFSISLSLKSYGFPLRKSTIHSACPCPTRIVRNAKGHSHITCDERVQFHNNSSKCYFRFRPIIGRKMNKWREDATREFLFHSSPLISIIYRRKTNALWASHEWTQRLWLWMDTHAAEREFRMRVISTSPTPLFAAFVFCTYEICSSITETLDAFRNTTTMHLAASTVAYKCVSTQL